MSAAVDLATRLAAQGAGTLGVDLVAGLMPDQPTACVSVLSYAGSEPHLRHPDGLPYDERPRVQVSIRAASFSAAEAKARQAYKAVHFRHLVINGTRYVWCEALQAPFFLKQDDSNRVLFAFNCELRAIQKKGE